ncbi:MAG: hypothetical protein HC871_00135 [Rhizobiales bacterium]|nr:hypothetical protein [Hyphomicrobiales bacterium]
MAAVLAALLMSKGSMAVEQATPDAMSCPGLSVSHFESRFPAKFKRITFGNDMLKPFVELWNAGSRPELPKPPERVVVYAFPGLPLIIGYQERHCIIAYLAIDGPVLQRWLHQHLGWNA